MNIWNSRRSPVISTKGVCASSQTLATSIGVHVLQNLKGNAADAAVAMAAALNVTEPCSTGIGGDAFALYYNAADRKVTCLQGNGASGSRLSLDLLHERGFGMRGTFNSKGEPLTPWDPHSGLSVTVPGAAALWDDIVKLHGSLSLSEVLEPAAKLAEDGFPIGPVTAEHWSEGYLQGEEAFRVFRPENRRKTMGNIIKNPDLANTFRTVGKLGAKEGFYRGTIANAIIEACEQFNGVLSSDDLDRHQTLIEEPISTVYKGIRVYQTPPPSQGLAVLLALNIFQKCQELYPNSFPPSTTTVNIKESYSNFDTVDWNRRNNIEETHIMIECMRIAFVDALTYIADPNANTTVNKSLEVLLSDEYALQRTKEIDINQRKELITPMDVTSPFIQGETVYFCVVDQYGNACSFINSNYMGFGTGIVPKGCGFTLQNRGYNFSLDPNHANVVQPNKRPYHTIIPGLAVYEEDRSLYAAFGNMGGFMQPMGHFQLLHKMIDLHMNPQLAIDSPRWTISKLGETQSYQDVLNSEVLLEDGYASFQDSDQHNRDKSDHRHYQQIAFAKGLQDRGHKLLTINSAQNQGIRHHPEHDIGFVMNTKRSMFGRAQVIFKDHVNNVFIAGSDPRADGAAMPVIL